MYTCVSWPSRSSFTTPLVLHLLQKRLHTSYVYGYDSKCCKSGKSHLLTPKWSYFTLGGSLKTAVWTKEVVGPRGHNYRVVLQRHVSAPPLLSQRWRVQHSVLLRSAWRAVRFNYRLRCDANAQNAFFQQSLHVLAKKVSTWTYSSYFTNN